MRARKSFPIVAVAFAIAPLGCGQGLDQPFCSQAGCEFSEWEWREIASLAELPEVAPEDPSNKYVGSRAAERLGHKFFYDTRYSGPSTQVDVLQRPASYARAPKGQATNLSCATCHDPGRAGIDTTSIPGNVAIGAGWADTNATPTFNAAFYRITYWNGRADSVWAQAVASNEGNNSNGNRLKTAWVIQDLYRAEYASVFVDHPLPLVGTSADLQGIVEASGPRAGQCKLVDDACPGSCRRVSDGGVTSCWPRFPLQGKPGRKPGCQAGDTSEPFGDAFDCMATEDQDAVTRVLVNWAKAIAAYEFRLVSRDSVFDRYVREVNAGMESSQLSPAARRGARLFVGKAACSDCHRTPLMSDSQFHNIGVPQVGPGVPTEADCPDEGVCDCVPNPSPDSADPMTGVRNCLPWGARDGLMKLRSNGFRRDSRWSDSKTDSSRKMYMDMSLDSVPKGSWRTPSLRDVALTAPYMHNGALATLEDVVRHYNVGGSPAAPGDRSARLKPLFLTPQEQQDLVEFLKSLTGAPLPAELVTAPELP